MISIQKPSDKLIPSFHIPVDPYFHDALGYGIYSGKSAPRHCCVCVCVCKGGRGNMFQTFPTFKSLFCVRLNKLRTSQL